MESADELGHRGMSKRLKHLIMNEDINPGASIMTAIIADITSKIVEDQHTVHSTLKIPRLRTKPIHHELELINLKRAISHMVSGKFLLRESA